VNESLLREETRSCTNAIRPFNWERSTVNSTFRGRKYQSILYLSLWNS